MSTTKTHYRFTMLAMACVGITALMSGDSPAGAGSPLPKPAGFAVGGPDSFGYRYADSQEVNGPVFNNLWEDIGASGSLIFGANVDDSVSSAIPIGFTFSFYGVDYTTCYVSSNGNMHFSNPSANYPGTSIPNASLPNAMIAGFWADDHTGPDGSIRSSSNATRFIVQWTSCEYYPSDNAETFTYQIRIEPSGTIYMLYQTMSANGGSNSTAIGIENAAGSVGLQYCFNGSPNVIANSRAIRFANNTAPDPPTAPVQKADSGGAPKPVGFVSDATAYFAANVTDPDQGNTVGIQVEILPSAVAFNPTSVTGETAQTPAASLVPSGSVAECLYTFDGTPFGSGDYHWRVRSIDNAGGSSSWVIFNSSQLHFTTDLDSPTVPVGPYNPDDGAGVGVVPPEGEVLFQWGIAVDTGPPGPLSYRVQVSASPGFATNLADEIVAGLEHRVTLQIASQPYYWHVAAIDQAGNQGPFILPISFTVTFNDPTDHGAGDCNISVGAAAGPLIPAAFAAALLAFGLARRRRA